MQRSSRVILLIGFVLALFLGLRMLIKPALPDSIQIQQQLSSATEAARQHNSAGVAAIISNQYHDESGNNPEQIRLLLARGFNEAQDLDVSMSPANIVVHGATAESTSYLTVRTSSGVLFNQLITLEWAKEDSRTWLILPSHTWRVTHSSYSGGLGEI